MPGPDLEIRNEREVRGYFDRLERDYPQLIEAMKVMNISYQQYLAALLALTRQHLFRRVPHHLFQSSPVTRLPQYP